MKSTLSWLKDYLETDAPLPRIAEVLTAIGLEVEQVTDRAAPLKDFIVAEIEEAKPHPNAGKLQVCRVNDGSEIRQIVCGAANARAGLKVVLAREGVYIPGSGITIRRAKIRDVESQGMLCSAEELQLEGTSEGIIELPETAQPGTPAAAALGADDPVIEIAITPNRADCLGVYGIARDLAAAGVGHLKALSPEGEGLGGGPATTSQLEKADPHLDPPPSRGRKISVTLATPHCPLFIGCLIRGVTNGPSPDWLQRRLRAIGLRPISALVDITNYITYTHARPLHVFDAAKLTGNITVRSARDGETLAALNGKTYTLAEGMTVIADDAKALAVGGIIGGEETGCTEATRDVFLEVALFDPVNIAQTGRALELQTDARYRFERGVDPAFVELGARLAVRMIRDLCGGEASDLVIAGKAPDWKRQIRFSPQRVATLGGVDVPAQECGRIVNALGFAYEQASDPWTVTPPSWRQDVEGEADVVEEILRIYGYDRIPATPLPKPEGASRPAVSTAQKRITLAKRTLAARGLLEACTYSFLPQGHARVFGGGQEELRLLNPISVDMDVMRPSLLPNLLAAAQKNLYRSLSQVRLFEAGVQFMGAAPGAQANAAAGLRAGGVPEARYDTQPFAQRERTPDLFDAKADVVGVLEALGVNVKSLTTISPAPDWYHPGRSGSVLLGKTVIAHFGEIHPRITAMFDIGQPVAAFEVLLDALPPPRDKGKKKPFTASAFQPVQRDFAFVADEALPAASLLRALEQAHALVTGAQLFDVYTGAGVETGKKSVAVQVTLQAPDRTLTDAEISTAADAVTAAAGKLGARLRQ